MKNEALRYPISELIFLFNAACGQTMIKRLNLLENMAAMLSAVFRGEPDEKTVDDLWKNTTKTRARYCPIFDLITDVQYPEAHEINHAIFLIWSDMLNLAVKHKIITGGTMERAAFRYLKTDVTEPEEEPHKGPYWNQPKG